MFGLFVISQEAVHADNACQIACSVSYQQCLVGAQDAYDQCLIGPEMALDNCEYQAEQSHQTFTHLCDYFLPYAWCYNTADSNWLEAQQECEQIYFNAEEGCYDVQQGITATCVNTYNACYNNCPPS